jgi:O-antigen/teichoic acid export membrane protein
MLMSAAFLASALVQFALGLLMAAMLGPKEFGLYALAFAASVIGHTLVFEWVRLSITRYQGSGAGVAARLDRALIGLIATTLLGAALVYALAGERRVLFTLVVVAAALWGFAECRAATLRAGFAEKSYVGLLLARALASLVLMPLAAWIWPRADHVLGALMLSVLLALLVHRLLSAPPRPGESEGPAPSIGALIGYALPIVATNLAYLLLFFALRLFIASRLGLAEAGSFSLALDLGLKLVMTLGSALDLYLFQLAVREDRNKGGEAGREQLAFNVGIVLAVLAPALVGLWLVLPSLEALVIAPDYRATFTAYLLMLLPGLFLFGLAQYALHPSHQLANRTFPLVIAALAALAAAFLLLGAGPWLPLPLPRLPGTALLAGMLVAIVMLWRAMAAPPPVAWLRLLPRLVLSLAVMIVAVLPIRHFLAPGFLALAASVAVGGCAYLVIAWLTDLANIRTSRARATKNGA